MKARKIIKRTEIVPYCKIKKDTWYINKDIIWGSNANLWYLLKPSKTYNSMIIKNRLIAVSLELNYFYPNSAIPQSDRKFREIMPDWTILENIGIKKELFNKYFKHSQ